MEDRTKIAFIAGGAYMAGRMKKGRSALRMVMWLSGDQSGPRAVNAARDGAMSLYQSEQVQQITKQLAGPITEAVQRAAVAMVMSRVQGLSDGLASRTEALQEVADELPVSTEALDRVKSASFDSNKKKQKKQDQESDDEEETTTTPPDQRPSHGEDQSDQGDQGDQENEEEMSHG